MVSENMLRWAASELDITLFPHNWKRAMMRKMKYSPVKRALHVGKRYPICGKGQLERVFGAETFTYKGQSKVVNMESFHCPVCGESFVDDFAASHVEPKLNEWHAQVDPPSQRA
jgi:YgiT-type zinc finger domain-containing protein